MLQVKANEKTLSAANVTALNSVGNESDCHDDIIIKTVPGTVLLEGCIEGPRMSCSFKLHILNT